MDDKRDARKLWRQRRRMGSAIFFASLGALLFAILALPEPYRSIVGLAAIGPLMASFVFARMCPKCSKLVPDAGTSEECRNCGAQLR